MGDVVTSGKPGGGDEGGSWVERKATQLARLLYDATHESGAKGGGVLKWSARGVDAALEKLGVEEDSVIRAQIARDVKSLDENGAYGVRILPNDHVDDLTARITAYLIARDQPPLDQVRVGSFDP